MKLYSYIIVKDRGLAPNPFWGTCTLAVCTPNHMGIKPDKGDWIIGISPKSQGNKLVYSMEVDETLRFDQYFEDERFQEKKPHRDGDWRTRCGDNFYEWVEKGDWKQHWNPYHMNAEDCKKDTKFPFVFISKNFYYFGENVTQLPDNFKTLVLDRQGCKKIVEPWLAREFVFWLKENHSPGVLGNPRDKKENDCASCS